MNSEDPVGALIERGAIEMKGAEEVSKEMFTWIQKHNPQVLEEEHGWPFFKLHDTKVIRDVACQYYDNRGRELVARGLEVSPDNVELEECKVILYVKLDKAKRERTVQKAKFGKLYTIIALNKLSNLNGLPKIGASKREVELAPGDALLIPGQLPQIFNGKSDESEFGFAILLIWRKI